MENTENIAAPRQQHPDTDPPPEEEEPPQPRGLSAQEVADSEEEEAEAGQGLEVPTKPITDREEVASATPACPHHRLRSPPPLSWPQMRPRGAGPGLSGRSLV